MKEESLGSHKRNAILIFKQRVFAKKYSQNIQQKYDIFFQVLAKKKSTFKFIVGYERKNSN